MTVKWTAAELESRIAGRYTKGWAFFPQVRDATGGAHHCTADAVAVGLWPSRGFEVHGFEIKVARADWLSDLNRPDKNDGIASECDFWWIVAAPGVVRESELPEKWGLLLPHGDKLRAKPRAKRRRVSGPLGRRFAVSLICKALGTDTVNKRQLASAQATGSQDGYARGLAENKRALANAVERRSVAEAAVSDFERLSGLSISMWDMHGLGEIAEAVRAIRMRDNVVGETLTRLRRAESLVACAHQDLASQIAALERLDGEAVKGADDGK